MRNCVSCKEELAAKQTVYNVTDLETDIVKIVEENIGREAKVHDSLCMHCFSTIAQSIEEEEIGSVKEVEIQDPLLEALDLQDMKHTASSEEYKLEEKQESKSLLNMSTVKTSVSEEDEDSDAKSSSSEHDPGPMVNLQSKTCIVCSEEFNKKQLFSLPLGPQRDAVEKHIHPKKLSRHSVICKNCLRITLETKEKNKPRVMNDVKPNVKQQNTESAESTFIYVPNYYAVGGTKKCFVKNCQYEAQTQTRKTVPKYMRRVLLENYNVFLSHTAHSCTEHRKEYYRDWSHLKDNKLYGQKFNSQQIEEMLEILRNDP